MAKKKKIFVLDTNVILHDSSCIYQFKEHDVVIPITVLEELDQFKKGNDTLNFHAREFVRSLDALSGDTIFEDGVKIGPGRGRISIKLEQEFHTDLALNFSNEKLDHHILNIAYILSKQHPTKHIILVSKDVNLRMKAKAIGLTAQDYKTDQVEDISSLYSGHRTEDNIRAVLIKQMYSDKRDMDLEDFQLQKQPIPNEYIIMRNGKMSALTTFDPFLQKIRRIDKTSAYGIIPRNAEQTFALNALMNPDIPLVSLTGKAGTGKTLLALAAALERRKQYRQIYIARPIVALSNKDIGFLPGDIQSKLDPYMQPLYDNLGVIQDQYVESDKKHKRIVELLEEEKLVIAPLSYIRGRSLVKIYFIVDEAQNHAFSIIPMVENLSMTSYPPRDGFYPHRFEISGDFRAGTQYTFTIDSTAQTIYGEPLEFSYSSSFTTDHFRVLEFSSPSGIFGNYSVRFYFNSEVNSLIFLEHLSIDPAIEVLTWNNITDRVYIEPALSWIPDTTFTFHLSEDLTDIDGNTLQADTSFSINVQPLQVLGTNPHHNQHFVPNHQQIQIRMNNLIDEGSIPGAVSLTPVVNYDISTNVSEGMSYFYIIPDSLMSQTTYTVTIDTTLKDYYGGNFEDGYSFSFVTQ